MEVAILRFNIRTGLVDAPNAPTEAVPVRIRRKSSDDDGFGTTFELDIFVQRWRKVGVLKVAAKGMIPGDSTHEERKSRVNYTRLPDDFAELPDTYFSLGADPHYYEKLVELLGTEGSRHLLEAMRDVAIVPGLFTEVSNEPVLEASLMKSTSTQSFDRYRRLINGDRSRDGFELRYVLNGGDPKRSTMDFAVDRTRRLPSNVHVIIGSNGTGKTTTLGNIRAAFEASETLAQGGASVSLSDREQIAGLLSISFSAFDTFPAMDRSRDEQLRFRSTNIRLPRISHSRSSVSRVDEELEAAREREREIGDYVREEVLGCLVERPDRLLSAYRLLKDSDLVLASHAIDTRRGLRKLNFGELSSGHKIALLTVASLVRYTEDRTLVLLDEPESHLHPPLLGAVARALSALMSEVNGLAIVATHSPVVLQEVPRRCAWIMWSAGGRSYVEQPPIETLGANLGVLTREVFGLELQSSGYHALLNSVASEFADYETAIAALNGEIGDEGKMLLRSLIRRQGK